MPIETICQGCNKRLRVADEHAGRLAKCPHCQTVYTVPRSPIAAAWGAGNATESSLPESDRWHLKTPDGLAFGPVARAELDRWLAEGRVTSASQILHEGDGQWVWAGQIYPQLGPNTALAGAPASPFAPGTLAKPIDLPAGPAAGSLNPYASPAMVAGYAPPPPRFREPSRGGLILTLSIIGPFICFFASVIALVLAINDLREIRQGVRDPEGKGLTMAGLIISGIYLGVVAIVILVSILAGVLGK